jgi:small-conductance mechanosensitive channel
MDQISEIAKQLKGLDSGNLLAEIVQFAVWILFIILITWLLRKAINRAVKDNSMRYRAKKAVRLLAYVLVLLLAIITFTGNVQYFTLTIGLVSAGLAFALQEVILSIAGWISIFSSNIYNPGDRIEINGVRGDVIDIGITKTTLMEIGEWVNSDNYSGRIVKVSNAFVFRGPVFNYSTDFPFLWDEINLPVKYGSDVELAGQVILDSAKSYLIEYAEFAAENWDHMVKKYLIENASTQPTLTLKLTDNWIEFNLRYVVDYKKRRITKHQLFETLQKAIEATQGKVALASATFEIVDLPELKVNVKNGK